MIGELYQVEDHLKKEGLTGERKRAYRQEQAKPIVDRFFAWVNERFEAQGLLPSNPLTKALAYARDRRQALEVFLSDPDVPIDTNHLERGADRPAGHTPAPGSDLQGRTSAVHQVELQTPAEVQGQFEP
jgi:hypothetical protein